MRSMIVGVVALSFFAALPTPGHTWPWDTEKTQQVVPPVPVGRFQIVIAQDARRTFLLDTVQGKVWQLTRWDDLEGEPLAWSQMSVLSEFADYDRFSKMHKPKRAATQPSDGGPPGTMVPPER